MIKLPCYGIVLNINKMGGGAIVSNLHENKEDLSPEEVFAQDCYNAAIDGMESLILSHACAGIDVKSPAYLKSIETTVNAIENNDYRWSYGS